MPAEPPVPVAPPETIAELRHEVDAVVCLEAPQWFDAIGVLYDSFRQVSDQTVVQILARFSRAGEHSPRPDVDEV